MPFTTLPYIGFFAALFFAYYAVPKKAQWMLLLAGSVFFYGYASPYYLIFLGITIGATYLGALGMSRAYAERDAYLKAHKAELDREGKKAYKAGVEKRTARMLVGVVVLLLVLLGVFKYLQFFLDNVVWLGGALGWHVQSPTLNLLLPVGLSFYIFQSMGYCIDVHREEIPAERNFFKHALFVSFFPQIMQGPIGRYGTLAPQLTAPHTFNYEQAVFGIQRAAWGFFKKFMVANTIADRINPCWTNVDQYPGAFCWTVIVALYAIQLYADFSGYMDIACGCSQMLGIKIDENFNCPYLSKSVSEFWRRWHMTLSSWFKDYLFYPLLRSDWNSSLRKRLSASKYWANVLPTALALSVVWFATGLWHGASWGYVAWGVYYGIFMIAGIVFQPLYDRVHAACPKLDTSRLYAIWQMVRTFAIVVVGYSIFKPANLSTTWSIWRQMVVGRESEGLYQIQYTLHHSFATVCIWIAVLFAVDVWHYAHDTGSLRALVRRLPLPVRWTLYLGAIWLVVFYGLYGSGFDQFEYFKF